MCHLPTSLVSAIISSLNDITMASLLSMICGHAHTITGTSMICGHAHTITGTRVLSQRAFLGPKLTFFVSVIFMSKGILRIHEWKGPTNNIN
jgi:hypothetical protein